MQRDHHGPSLEGLSTSGLSRRYEEDHQGDCQHRRRQPARGQIGPGTTGRRRRSLSASQGHPGDDGIRGGRGSGRVARLALPALPRQGFSAGRGNRAPQQRVLGQSHQILDGLGTFEEQLTVGVRLGAVPTTPLARWSPMVTAYSSTTR